MEDLMVPITYLPKAAYLAMNGEDFHIGNAHDVNGRIEVAVLFPDSQRVRDLMEEFDSASVPLADFLDQMKRLKNTIMPRVRAAKSAAMTTNKKRRMSMKNVLVPNESETPDPNVKIIFCVGGEELCIGDEKDNRIFLRKENVIKPLTAKEVAS